MEFSRMIRSVFDRYSIGFLAVAEKYVRCALIRRDTRIPSRTTSA